MRAAARLNIGDVLRVRDVADVEDANSAQSQLAHRVLHTLGSAVDASAEILTRDDQQISIDRHVTLRGRAEVRGFERRLPRIRDVPDLVAVEAALKDVVARER